MVKEKSVPRTVLPIFFLEKSCTASFRKNDK